MGTSISQGSPRKGPNWKPVFKCYEDCKIPEDRIINEIWRASDNEMIPISTQLKSEAIYNCYEIVKNSVNAIEALNTYNKVLFDTKKNSIVAEFAKRAIPLSFQEKYPADAWANKFFAEVTNYFVSRDSSGFVGENFRNKTVDEMIDFKKNLSLKVGHLISSERKSRIDSLSSWNSFIDKTIKKLKTE